MQKFAATLALAILAVFACPAANAQDIRAAIEAQNKKFSENVSKNDTAAIAAMYTKDGMVLPPNGGFVQGQEAIKGLFQGLISAGIKGITLTTTEVDHLGKTVNEVGTYSLKAADGKELDKGKYIVIWKNENGQWKLHRDMFNTSNPAPTSPAPLAPPASAKQ